VQYFGLFVSNLPQFLSSPANFFALNGLNIGQDSKIIFARETSFSPNAIFHCGVVFCPHDLPAFWRFPSQRLLLYGLNNCVSISRL
jgi:hypothetical protein